MKDDKRFRIFIILMTILVVVILSYNVTQEFFKTEIGGYLTRKLYFEEVLQPKDLPMHPAEYWRKINE